MSATWCGWCYHGTSNLHESKSSKGQLGDPLEQPGETWQPNKWMNEGKEQCWFWCCMSEQLHSQAVKWGLWWVGDGNFPPPSCLFSACTGKGGHKSVSWKFWKQPLHQVFSQRYHFYGKCRRDENWRWEDLEDPRSDPLLIQDPVTWSGLMVGMEWWSPVYRLEILRDRMGKKGNKE